MTPSNAPRTKDLAAALKQAAAMMEALREAINAAGAQGIPSGHLYAHLIGKLSLQHYQAMISAMVEAGKITIDGQHVLRGKK